MVQISVDTKHDSAATLRRVIQMLEEELRERGHQPITPLQGSNQSIQNPMMSHLSEQRPPQQTRVGQVSPDQPLNSDNPFSMFDDTSTTQVAREAAGQEQNPFSSILDPIEKSNTPKSSVSTQESSTSSSYGTLAHSPDMFSTFHASNTTKEAPSGDELLKNLTASELLKETNDDNDNDSQAPSTNIQLEPY